MGIFTKTKSSVASATKMSFSEQLTNIKEVFRNAYQKAENLSREIETDIAAKTARIATLQSQLQASETVMKDTEKFMKSIENFI